MDPAEPLYPRMVEDILLGGLFRLVVHMGGVLHVPVDRVIDEADSLVGRNTL
jgi:hypothetical protein